MARVIESAQRVKIDGQIVAAGGSANALELIAAVVDNQYYEVIGYYLRQTAGALRKIEVFSYDGTTDTTVSDKSQQNNLDDGGGILENRILLVAGESLRMIADAAANDATIKGKISYYKYSLE